MTHPRLYITMLISVLTISTLACGASLPTTNTANPAPTPTTENTPYVTDKISHVCKTPYLNIRTGAGEEYPRKSWLEEGAEVIKITETYSIVGSVWYVVNYAGGVGYVNSRYVCE